MSMPIPADVPQLILAIGREHAQYSYGGQMAVTDELSAVVGIERVIEVGQALDQLAIAAEGTLVYLPHNLVRANNAFTTDVKNFPELTALLADSKHPYLRQLIEQVRKDAEQFNGLLAIFVQLQYFTG